MNHLAHFHLSFQEPGLVLGNWAGDVVKGNDWQQYPPDIQLGIHLHRAIDSFTDSHPATQKLSAQIRPFAGRYAGPVGDVMRDHFLSVCWLEFNEHPLQQFANSTYKTLEDRMLDLPSVLQERTPRMIAGNWLLAYDSLGEINFVLERLKKRMKNHPLETEKLLRFVASESEDLVVDFREFYPALRNHAMRFSGLK